MMTLFRMMPGLLLVALAAPGLLVILGGLQLARRAEAHAGWLSGLLGLIGSSALLIVLVYHAFVQPVVPDPVRVLAVWGLVELAVGGLFVMLIERRRETFLPEGSYGLLLAGIGFLTVMASIFVPVLPGQFSPPAPALVPTQTASPTWTPRPTLATTLAPTITPNPTLTATMSPRPSERPTRVSYQTPTPSATPTVNAICGAVVNYNLNLRRSPSLDAEVLLVIPYETIIAVAARTVDGTWWFVAYDGSWGWVDVNYISLDTDCSNAPVLP